MKTIEDIKAICYLAEEEKTPLVRRFLELPGKELYACGSEGELHDRIAFLKAREYRSKEVLILAPFRGRLFQKCPGSPGMICCNYYLLNTCFDCLYNCAYCFLSSYLNSFGIVQFTNVGDIAAEFAGRRDFVPGMLYRLGTGEFTDSLMMDQVTDIASSLIEVMEEAPHIVLEFKTKSDNVNHLLDIPRKGTTVLAWSLNTERNIARYEEDTASLQRRIDAAARAGEAGFFLAFHFDPIIMYPGFLDDYRAVLDRLYRAVDPQRILWISLGCFRYAPSFKDILRDACPGEGLTLEEMFPGPDGKYRYLAPRREEIYAFMRREIASRPGDPFVYMCMETASMWHRVFGRRYDASADLERDFSAHLENIFDRFFPHRP
jgi:spore photoproduct lyase